MAAAVFCARPQLNQRRVAIALLIVLPIPALYFILHVYRLGPLIDQIWGVVFAAALVLLSHIPDTVFDRNAIGRFFVWLGTISYSLYLVHQPLIEILTMSRMHIHSYLLAGLVRLPILILLGYLFHLGVERHFMRVTQKPKQFVATVAIESPAP
jgi:peptidoglycan/LPS O-acetylase OafA/YrhL